MDINEEIKMGRLMIALNTQYKKQAESGDIKAACETIEKLTKLKTAFPKIYDKTMLFNH